MGCSVSKDEVVTRPTIPDPGIRKKKVMSILEKLKCMLAEVEFRMFRETLSVIAQNYFLMFIEEMLEEIAWAFPRVCWVSEQIVRQLEGLADEPEKTTLLNMEYEWWKERFNSLTSFQKQFLSLKQSILRFNVKGIVDELDALEEDDTVAGDTVVDTVKRIPLPVSSGNPFACPTELTSTGPQPNNTA